MAIQTVTDAIRYVGVDDNTLALFENQYSVQPMGVSYNSYVILDEKIAVMDSVDARAAEEWLSNVARVLEGRSPDYLVVTHMEPDHSGSLMRLAQKYPEEEKETVDSVSSGERTRKSPNRDACIAGFGLHKGFSNGRRTALEQPAREGESPVSEARADPAGSRVPRDTGNPVGTSGDHSVRLNTTQ